MSTPGTVKTEDAEANARSLGASVHIVRKTVRISNASYRIYLYSQRLNAQEENILFYSLKNIYTSGLTL
jgi:hypothetical protein